MPMPDWKDGLQNEIDTIERTHPGYDEYRYDLANIGHNPHELASLSDRKIPKATPAPRYRANYNGFSISNTS